MPSSGSTTVTPVVSPAVSGASTPAPGTQYHFNSLPLETWREYYGFKPWQFWNLHGALVPDDGCVETVKGYAWQAANRPGREDIARAIRNAEDVFLQEAKFSVAPRFVEELVAFPRYYDPRLANRGVSDANGRWMAVRVGEGYVQKLGVETYTALSLALPITLSDADGDGVWDTFVSDAFATSLIESQVNEIEVYYASADRLDSEPAGEAWRIAPVSVVVTGGSATVRGRAWQVTAPIKQQSASGVALDVATASSYVTTIDVYRHWCDPTGLTAGTVQATLTWETPPWPSGCCGDTTLTFTDASGDPSALATLLARAGIRDSTLGLVYLGESVYDASSGFWSAVSWGGCRPPDKALIRYQAGYPLENGRYASAPYRNGKVSERMVRIIAMLSAAKLGRSIDACSVSNRLLTEMQFDLARSSGANDESYGLTTREVLNCPWGTRRGAVLAWKEAQRLEVAHGVSL